MGSITGRCGYNPRETNESEEKDGQPPKRRNQSPAEDNEVRNEGVVGLRMGMRVERSRNTEDERGAREVEGVDGYSEDLVAVDN